MKPFYRDLRLSLIVAVTAFAVCWISSSWHPALDAHQADSHGWLHKELHITSDQEKKLIPIEQKFAARKQSLEMKIREANIELSKAMLEDKRYSDRVQAGIDTIHHAQGELQKATMEHLFEMQTVLTPEQADKLNKFAADALATNP